jgi:CheY-like chemotaxis protein
VATVSTELTSIKMLIVSEAATERVLLRHAASTASVRTDIAEVDDAVVACKLLSQDAFDVICFDSRLTKEGRSAVLDAARAAAKRPLAIFVGPAEMKTRKVLTDGLDVDGVLAKPLELREITELVTNCFNARLPHKILVVDDSSTVRSVVRKVLNASRFQIELEEVEEGGAAIDVSRRQHFDIVFLDCNMPGLDGFDALRTLKHEHPDIKVVMMTGMLDPRTEERARNEGAKDFLYKPFFPKDINAVLNRLFCLMPPRWN